MKHNQRYDIVAGISFGSTILAAVLHLLEARLYPTRAVLGDPVLDMDCTAYPHSRQEGMTREAHPFPLEEDLVKLPGWSRQDAILKRWSLTRTEPDAVYGLFKVSDCSVPIHRLCSQSDRLKAVERGACSHDLLVGTEHFIGTEIVVVSADPRVGGVYGEPNHSCLRENFPHITLHVLGGASHDLHRDRAEIFAKLIAGTVMIQLGPS